MTDEEKIAALRASVGELLTLVRDLMPGIGKIAVPDYQLVNEAPIRALKALEDTE